MTNLPSLEQTIKRQITHRILVALCVSIIILITLTAYEVLHSVRTFEGELETQAKEIGSIVLSEILVDNEMAIEPLLASEGSRRKFGGIKWISGGFDRSAGIHAKFPFEWEYLYHVNNEHVGPAGTLVFSGKLSSFFDSFVPLLARVGLLAGFAVVILVLLFPLASTIPATLIVEPVRDLVKLAGSQNPNDLKFSGQYREIESIYDDFRNVLLDNKRLERENLEVQKLGAIAQAVQMLAHDIRHPFEFLRMILPTFTKVGTLAKARSIARSLEETVTAAIKDIDNLFEELKSLRHENQVTPVVVPDASGLLSDIVKRLAVIFSEKKVHLVEDFTSKRSLHVDRAKIERAMANILTNAFQSVPDGGRICIGTRDIDDNEKRLVEVRIGNSGSYLSPDDREKVFDLFFTKGKQKGTGLGLAIAQHMVRAHGGRIWCESCETGGTQFIFTLPAHDLESNITPLLAKVSDPTNSSLPAKMV